MKQTLIKKISELLVKHPAPWVLGEITNSAHIYDSKGQMVCSLNSGSVVLGDKERNYTVIGELVIELANDLDLSIKNFLAENPAMQQASTENLF